MSFADPQSITVNAVAQSMPRVSSGVNSGVFRKDDTTYELVISHGYGKRTRRTAKFTNSKIIADAYITDTNVKVSGSVSLVVDLPPTGYTVAEAKLIIDGFLAYLTASSGAKVTQLLGGEN